MLSFMLTMAISMTYATPLHPNLLVTADTNPDPDDPEPDLSNCGPQPFSITKFTTFEAPVTGHSTISFLLTNPNWDTPVADNIQCDADFAPGQGGPISDSSFWCASTVAAFRYATAGVLEVEMEFWCENTTVQGYGMGSIPIISYPFNGGTMSETPTGQATIDVQAIIIVP